MRVRVRGGIARFATTRYQKPTRQLGLEDDALTNYSLNKHSADFVHTETDDEGERALTALWKDLRAKGTTSTLLWPEIRELVVKTVAPIQPLLAHAYRAATRSREGASRDGGAETREGRFPFEDKRHRLATYDDDEIRRAGVDERRVSLFRDSRL